METQNRMYLLVIITFFLSSCMQNNQDDFVANWKKDKFGCENLRNYKYLEDINSKYLFVGKKVDELESKLGKADSVIEKKNNLYFRYYFDGICRNKTIVDSSDYCYVNYKVDRIEKKVLDIHKVCR